LEIGRVKAVPCGSTIGNMTGSKLPLHPGALSHYVDPEAYRRRYAGREEDVAYYVRIGRRAGGAVLEYGAGNGRITLALARTGVEVTGMDASRFMVADLKARLLREAPAIRRRVRIVHGDMRTKRLGRRFKLVIMPFNVFCHLYARQDAELLLRRVRQHLLPGGRLVFDVYLPRFSELATGHGGSHYDPLSQVLTLHFDDQPPSVLSQRQFFPQELRMLLKYNGFQRVRLRADFQNRPLDEDTETLVVSASPMT
jgi:SAM-dependent methyltransferase